jgi:quinate dehydrogenase (quinone)
MIRLPRTVSVRTPDAKGKRPSNSRYLAMAVGVLMLGCGLPLTYGGVTLLLLGGSAYYVTAGVGLIVSGLLILLNRSAGVWLYGLIVLITLAWSLWEVGFRYWALFPRLFAPLLLFLFSLIGAPALRAGPGPAPKIGPRTARMTTVLLLCVLVGYASHGFSQHGVVLAKAERSVLPRPVSTASAWEWRSVGGSQAGTRFAPFREITPANVGQLEVAWTARTGDMQGGGAANEATPLQIGNTLYVCTPNDWILAIDSETGKIRWRFDPGVKPGVDWRKCRGVSYYEQAGTKFAPAVPCQKRILFNTIDTRLMALDAITGKLCVGFGQGGTVDLRQGMGPIEPGFYMQTSAPTIARDLVVVGGWVADNRAINEPGGVIRAFNAVTGRLVWAWDPGDPRVTRLPVKDGHYTRATPNVWSIPSVDEKLGMVYLPTGNATPDFWGASRHPLDDAFSSSVVALSLTTGRVRWKFQTVHHDLWDYDVASQPILYDIPDARGGLIPALIQLTKQGQIFLLDRRTGVPLSRVEERAVPVDGEAGDRLSATQPFSVEMPSLGNETLTERSMWGITPLDQLWCRINYRQMRYHGMFTPPTTDLSMLYPGPAGGANWGSGAIDAVHSYLIVNDIRLPFFQRLIARSDYARIVARAAYNNSVGGHFVGPAPNTGAPFASDYGYVMSPLGVPCKEPPYGTLTAIDLRTRKIVWQRPAGTVEDAGPFKIRTRLPMPIGMATMGGPLATASGLIFYSGTQDQYVRAFDVRDGRELWKARLPVGSTATPMTYVTRNGRQFVVVNAGGSVPFASGVNMPRGDYLIAYALPPSRG